MYKLNMFYDLLIYMEISFMVFMMIILTYKYMLLMLMILELLVLNISLVMYMMMSFQFIEFYMIYYLVFTVCESSMGLALLVMISRFYGNELYYLFNLVKF